MVHSILSYSSNPTDTIIQQCHTEDSMSSHCGMFVGFLVSVDSYQCHISESFGLHIHSCRFKRFIYITDTIRSDTSSSIGPSHTIFSCQFLLTVSVSICYLYHSQDTTGTLYNNLHSLSWHTLFQIGDHITNHGQGMVQVHSVHSYASHPTGTNIQQCHTDDSMSSHCRMFIGFLVLGDSHQSDL